MVITYVNHHPPSSHPPAPPQQDRRQQKSRSKGGGLPATDNVNIPQNGSRSKKRRGKARPESHAREATIKSLDDLGLSSTPIISQSGRIPQSKRSSKSKKRSQHSSHHPSQLPYPYPIHHSYTHQQQKRKTDDDYEGGGASSGDEYSGNLLETYIGQVGACAALGMRPQQVLNVSAWESFTDEERESLMAHLPVTLSTRLRDSLARRLLNGAQIYFGAPRDQVFEDVAAGLTHPRVRRWRLRVSLIERRHHIMSMREFHNRGIRRLLARKACVSGDSPAFPLAGVAAVGGNLTKTGGALQALPGRIQATAEAAVQSGVNHEWDEKRWRRVLDFRNQETLRYKMPERAFRYRNPWGDAIVGPLKRGPALDGGRPREHILLRNERPSHVTILCIVRDAASRLPGGRGTRADICDLLRDSQYIREGATYQQLNTVVSGALDRLHYEESAPVKYDGENKEWVYLHNHLTEDDFERPAWARETAQRQMASGERGSGARGRSSKSSKKKRRKTADD